jgi:Holliday junction resolvasome RuvABC DNA-binding subunit
VKSEAQKSEEAQQIKQTKVADLSALEGIGPKTADVLIKAGMADVYRLATFSVEDLLTVQGIGDKTAAKIIESSKKFVAENPREKAAVAAAPAEPAAEAGDDSAQTAQAEEPVAASAKSEGEKS